MEEIVDSKDESKSNEPGSFKNDSIEVNDESSNTKININITEQNLTENNKNISKEENNEKLSQVISKETKLKPKKEIPIEKKPFNEFVNDHLMPSLIKEFNERGFEVENISFKNTSRPISGDKCWVIHCEIRETCSFWLSFEQEDISSLKSISLCRPSQKPSVIESFLIDEKRITLKLIISRILQRLNGQKLIGVN